MSDTATSISYEHYNRQEVRNTIHRIAQDGANSRCGNGDFSTWYKSNKRAPLTHFNLSHEADYNILIGRHKTLYWSLNLFDPYLFTLDFNQKLPEYERIPKANSPRISKTNTNGYTFSVDIDAVGDIHEPDVKKAVEDLAQFHVDEFRKYAPKSVYVLFSGGGVYVHVHHKVFQDYFDTLEYPYDESIQNLLNGFSEWLDEISKNFFVKYPVHKGKAKADSLNGAKRIFKTIFSLHKSKPYSVIPLNPDNVKIDFENAKLPLKPDVLDTGDRWYRDYDNDGAMLDEVRAHIGAAKAKAPIVHYGQETAYECSETPIDIELWPPCIKNMLALETCGEGKTRALAVLAAFMGQMGLPEQDAYNLFTDTARRWNAETTNIFQSHFMIMRVPTCRTLTADNNTGYPHGRSLRILDICKPNIQCINCISPRYYADKKANIDRLRRKLIGTKPKTKERAATPEIKYSLIRLTQSVPVFAGVDGRSYLLGAHDIATIPTTNATVLINRKLAVHINQGVTA